MAETKKTLAYPADVINDLLEKVENGSVVVENTDTQLNAESGKPIANSTVTDALGRKLSKTEAERDYAKKSDIIVQGEDAWYGIEYDVTVSSPTCTRIGSAALHAQLPIQSQMRGCLLSDSGEVMKYLDSRNWTAETRDGTKGQVMVEIPSYYRMFETSGNKRRVKISTLPLAGYTLVPRMYVSAYEAALDRNTLVLSSVVNTAAKYRGGDNTSAWDGTYRSLLGMPVTKIPLQNLRTYARNRNNAQTAEWNTLTYDVVKSIYWLFVVEYATLNSQLSYSAALTSNGYRQGGLGAGVTTLDGAKLSSYNGTNPIIPCGFTDSLGNSTGVKVFNMPTQYADEATSVYVPRYRGVENPFGHINKLMDGCKILIAPSANTDFYTCSNPERYSSYGTTGYDWKAELPRDDGYIKSWVFGPDGECVASALGGTSTTYICDYYYASIPSGTSVETRVLQWGGNAQSGVLAGLGYTSFGLSPTTAAINVGTRLSFIPNI